MVNELGRPESENEVLFTGNSDGIPAAAVHSSFLGETSVIWRSESTGGNRVRRANSLGSTRGMVLLGSLSGQSSVPGGTTHRGVGEYIYGSGPLRGPTKL